METEKGAWGPSAQVGADNQEETIRSTSPPTRSYLISLVVVFGVSLSIIGLSSSKSVFGGTLPSSILSEESTSSDFWTLVREGYEPLDFFVNKGVTKMTYKVLADHDGVIEPGAEMELYV